MKKLFVLAVLAALPAALTACCSGVEARFWQMRDEASGRTAFTADTALVPLDVFDPKYVDASGREVRLDRPVSVRQMTETEWTAATGGAGYGLSYCTQHKACWASVRPK